MSKQILRFSVPISRVDDEQRVVEGYAFVNEVVKGEGGLRLKRSAMEAATPDYMRWGAVREMHQPSAVGTSLGVEWDDKGAYIRAKIVDDQAWEKVKERVYKAFSIGVHADVMRGKDVEQCTWVETSLVDRPKDTDADIQAFRFEMPATEEPESQDWRYEPLKEMLAKESAERREPALLEWAKQMIDRATAQDSTQSVVDALQEVYLEIKEYREGSAPKHERIEAHRAKFADLADSREQNALRSASIDWLMECIYWGFVPEGADPVEHFRSCLAEFESYWLANDLCIGCAQDRSDAPELVRGITSDVAPVRENLEGKKRKTEDDDEEEQDDETEGAPHPDDLVKPRAEHPDFARIQSENAELTRLVGDLESKLEVERSENGALRVRVQALEDMPARTRPVAYTGAGIPRTFSGSDVSGRSQALRDELASIMSRASQAEEGDRAGLALRVSQIKAELAQLGV